MCNLWDKLLCWRKQQPLFSPEQCLCIDGVDRNECYDKLNAYLKGSPRGITEIVMFEPLEGISTKYTLLVVFED